MNTRAVNRLLEGPPNNLIYVNANLTANIMMHQRTMLLNVSGGATVSLPSAKGQGLTLFLVVSVVSTTGYIINTNGTDVFQGWVDSNTSGSTPATAWWTSTANKTFTLNGTTKGGSQIGDSVYLIDILKGTWAINASVTNTGSVATPFSN